MLDGSLFHETNSCRFFQGERATALALMLCFWFPMPVDMISRNFDCLDPVKTAAVGQKEAIIFLIFLQSMRSRTAHAQSKKSTRICFVQKFYPTSTNAMNNRKRQAINSMEHNGLTGLIQ